MWINSIEREGKPFKHALVEVAAHLYLSAPIGDYKKVETAAPGVFSEEGRFVPSLHINANIAPETGEITGESKPNGITFQRFQDKRFVGAFQILNHNPPLLSYHSFEYLSWKQYFAETVGYLKACIEIFPDIYVDTLGLTWIDRFYWQKETPPPIEAIFKFDALLPPRLKDKASLAWQLFFNETRTLSYKFQDNNGADIDDAISILMQDALEIMFQPGSPPSFLMKQSIVFPRITHISLQELLALEEENGEESLLRFF